MTRCFLIYCYRIIYLLIRTRRYDRSCHCGQQRRFLTFMPSLQSGLMEPNWKSVAQLWVRELSITVFGFDMNILKELRIIGLWCSQFSTTTCIETSYTFSWPQTQRINLYFPLLQVVQSIFSSLNYMYGGYLHL